MQGANTKRTVFGKAPSPRRSNVSTALRAPLNNFAFQRQSHVNGVFSRLPSGWNPGVLKSAVFGFLIYYFEHHGPSFGQAFDILLYYTHHVLWNRPADVLMHFDT